MYYVQKQFSIEASHRLKLPYESKCRNLHGHSWRITVYVKSEILDDNGMVVDFTHVKHAIKDNLDHACLSDLFDFNTTSENLARWICDKINELAQETNNCAICYRVDVQEAEGSIATYQR